MRNIVMKPDWSPGQTWAKSYSASSPWASMIAQLGKSLPAMQEAPVRFLGREDPLEKG